MYISWQEIKRALYTPERALYIQKRALHIPERALPMGYFTYFLPREALFGKYKALLGV